MARSELEEAVEVFRTSTGCDGSHETPGISFHDLHCVCSPFRGYTSTAPVWQQLDVSSIWPGRSNSRTAAPSSTRGSRGRENRRTHSLAPRVRSASGSAVLPPGGLLRGGPEGGGQAAEVFMFNLFEGLAAQRHIQQQHVVAQEPKGMLEKDTMSVLLQS